MTFQMRQLTDKEFKHYCDLVYNECGIHLTAEKRQLLNARISKRLRKLGVDAREYMEHIRKDKNELNNFCGWQICRLQSVKTRPQRPEPQTIRFGGF